MIDLIAAAGIGGTVGFFACALLTGGRIADEIIERMDAEDEADEARNNEAAANRVALEALDAHTRCSDALTTTQRKLSAIRDLLDKPRTIRKGDVALILDGETL